MSLSIAGVWDVDVWDQSVWEDGVWREGESAVVVGYMLGDISLYPAHNALLTVRTATTSTVSVFNTTTME